MRVRKVQKKKFKARENPIVKFNNEITGVLLISLGLLTALSLYSDMAGVFGGHLGSFLLGMAGCPAFITPLAIIAYGYYVLVRKNSLDLNLKTLYIFILCVSASAIIHLFCYSDDAAGYFSADRVAMLYASGMRLEGGGVIGGLLAIPIARMFGIAGAFVVFLTLMVVFTILATNVSVLRVIKRIKTITDAVSAAIMKMQRNRGRKPVKKQVPVDAKQSESDYDIGDARTARTDKSVGSKVISTVNHDGLPDGGKIPAPKEEKPAGTEKTDKVGTVNIDTHRENGGGYVFPPISLLGSHGEEKKSIGASRSGTVADNAKKLEGILKSFGVDAKVVNVSRGPTVTRYELHPNIGVKVSKIVNLADDIALNLAAAGVRIEAPIPGKAAVGIEVPNKENVTVSIRNVLETDNFKNHPSKLSFALGRSITGECIVADIAKMPHLLIAGATGAGKSVCINAIITSLLYKATPEEVKLLMIDTKVVELGIYNSIPHLLVPVVTDPKKAAGALNWAVQEMLNRYKLFAEKGVRDIRGYNAVLEEMGEQGMMPQIVILIDELADLMMVAPGEVEDSICRLAQMARAAGMHLVIATQRPSVDVITGVIKANIPSRISFAVSSQVDSRTILDMAGAEKLLGKGDMLFYPVGEPKPIRVQGAFISDKEVEAVVGFIKKQNTSEYDENIIEEINNAKEVSGNGSGDNDELLPQAIEAVVDAGHASVSLIQRKFKVGYARAARIIDQMEARGIIGGFEGSKPRQVRINKQQFQEMLMNENSEGGVS